MRSKSASELMCQDHWFAVPFQLRRGDQSRARPGEAHPAARRRGLLSATWCAGRAAKGCGGPEGGGMSGRRPDADCRTASASREQGRPDGPVRGSWQEEARPRESRSSWALPTTTSPRSSACTAAAGRAATRSRPWCGPARSPSPPHARRAAGSSRDGRPAIRGRRLRLHRLAFERAMREGAGQSGARETLWRASAGRQRTSASRPGAKAAAAPPTQSERPAQWWQRD